MASEEAPSERHVVLARDRFRVTMSDTDAARLIYFGAPARWAQRLLTTWLADVGTPLSKSLDSGFDAPWCTPKWPTASRCGWTTR
jgi:hypothetical protein